MKVVVGILSVMFLSIASFAQGVDLSGDEDRLVQLLEALRTAENNADKDAKNKAFKDAFAKVAEKQGALSYPFSRLETVGVIDSPDKLVRIINWNVEQDDQTQRYYGFVIRYDKRKKRQYVTELREELYGLQKPEGILTSDQWYGALYYKIIPVKKGSKTVYTLLGWDGHTTMSTMKVVDIMYFTGKIAKFGSPMFKLGKETKKRLFYEYSEKTVMTLRYEQDRNRIMMDHLSPETPSMKGYYSFYVPDLSYDCLKFQGSKWILHEDVIGINKGNSAKTQEVIVKNPKTGKLEKQAIKSKWQSPQDSEAPVAGIEHVAVTPESEAEAEEENKKNAKNSREPEYNKKDKRDPNNLSTINGKGRKKSNKRRRRRN